MRSIKVVALVLALMLIAVGCTILAATRPDQTAADSKTPVTVLSTTTDAPTKQPNISTAVSVTAPATAPNPISKVEAPTTSVVTPAPAQSTKTTADSTPKGVFKNGQEIWIDVDQGQQKVAVHEGDKVIRTFVVSTGLPDQPTPNGTFYIQNRDTWFYSSEFKEGAQYWVSFLNWGEYLFHSVPMDENQQIIPAEAQKLGQKASHGCVRLTVDDAKWLYDNIEANTRVVIHD